MAFLKITIKDIVLLMDSGLSEESSMQWRWDFWMMGRLWLVYLVAQICL
jgi:hypothetical protein